MAVCTSLLLAGCASKPVNGYGLAEQAVQEIERQQAAEKSTLPNQPGVYLSLIQQMQQKGLYFASLAHIDAYERQWGASPQSTLLRAEALRLTAQPERSIEYYTKLLGTTLGASGFRGLGLLAGAKGDFPAAAKSLQKATELDPTNPLLQSDLGYARLRMGDVKGARVPIMQAVELDRNNPKILSNLALFFMVEGQQIEANEVIEHTKMSLDTRQAIYKEAALIEHNARVRARSGALTTGESVPLSFDSTLVTSQGLVSPDVQQHGVPSGFLARMGQ
ncbi:tetratricopeptide repeat protein [Crenobacter sp. SG2303]|uniref:Tetratricopeptide repeat protein n=1 Tax=Crenobacter oryzisoli TaxID=3056844 RepID=A0ABT7XTJ9_9NEIS|nr:tetratricopeptide repeat protein [Crenobacter sp. SG2303]MDN0077107.1 tetratricopeptide repeat protein [Crenobacter sp. SG2303]